MGEGLLLLVHFLGEGVAWDVIHQQEGTVFVVALDGVVVFGEVAAADRAEVAENGFLVADLLDGLLPLLVLGADSGQLHQHHFLELNCVFILGVGVLGLLGGLVRSVLFGVYRLLAQRLHRFRVEKSGWAGDHSRPAALCHEPFSFLVVADHGDGVEDVRPILRIFLGGRKAEIECGFLEAANLLLGQKQSWLSV